MKKWILIIVGVVIAVIVGIVIIGITNIGPIIKRVVNTYGPDITKTDVHIEKVDVALFKARVKLKNFYLGNPKGFLSPRAMTVGVISMDVDEKSLNKDPVVIERIEIIAPDINYEKTKGSDNFRVIMKNIQESMGQKKGKETAPSEAGPRKGKGKKIIIKDLIIRDGRVSLTMSLLGKRTISTRLPDIHLRNIGQKEGGASPEQIARQLLSQIYAKINSPDVMNLFVKKLKDMGFGMESIRVLKGGALEKIKRQVQEKMGTEIQKKGLKSLKQQVEEKIKTMGKQKDEGKDETGQVVDQLKSIFNR